MKKHLLALALIAAAGGSQAATITVSAPLNMQTTEIDQNLSVSKFDSSLGTLTGVQLNFDFGVDSSASLTNNAAQGQIFGFESKLNFFVQGPSALFGTKAINLFSFGPAPIASQQTIDLGTVSLSDVFSAAGNVADFTGTGTTSFSCTTLAGNSQVGGGANIAINQATTAGCGVSVVYTYDVPTPQGNRSDPTYPTAKFRSPS